MLLAVGLMGQSVQAQPSVEWSASDQALLAAGTVLHLVDWGQTRYIVKNPDRYWERNIILGKYPTMGEVNAYMLATALLIPVLAHYFPEYRSIILGLWVATQATVVGHNHSIGVRISW